MQRREAKNRPERPQTSPETGRVKRYRRKSPQKRPIWSRPCDSWFGRTGWWRMQSCETGLDLRNREFPANSGLKQAIAVPAAADHTNFAPNLNRLDQPPGTFLLLRRTGSLRAITGHARETTGSFRRQIRRRRASVSRKADGRLALLGSAAWAAHVNEMQKN
jgi:hypothetical protein